MEIRVVLFRLWYDVSELIELDRLTVQFYQLLYTSFLFRRTRIKEVSSFNKRLLEIGSSEFGIYFHRTTIDLH